MHPSVLPPSKCKVRCNPQLRVTVFRSDTNPIGEEHSLDWYDTCAFVEICGANPVKTKKALKLFKMATFANNHRSNENLQLIYGIEGDYDAGIVAAGQAVKHLRDSGIEAFIYTTASHTEARPRFRILCPLSTPRNAIDHNMLAARLNGVVGGILARESFVPSQSYYVGSVEGCVPMQCYHVQGQPIDLIPNLPSIGSRMPIHSTVNGKRSNNGKKATNYEIAREALFSCHPADGDRAWWLAFSGAFYTAVQGLVADEVALSDWQKWNEYYGQ